MFDKVQHYKFSEKCKKTPVWNAAKSLTYQIFILIQK